MAVSRQGAWNGFYKAIRSIKQYEQQAKAQGHDCDVRTRRRMAEARAARFARILVLQYGWQDVHTAKYIIVQRGA